METKLAYSLAELAKISGVGRSFIYQEINSGHLLVRKAGRRTLVLRQDAEDWLKAFPSLAANTAAD